MTSDLAHCCGVSNVDFEQLNAGQVFKRRVIDKHLHFIRLTWCNID